jgi:Uma2 family endonuclease
MAMSIVSLSSLRHRRAVKPVEFPVQEPEQEKLGESTRHLTLRTALWQLLRLELAGRATVGSEQFVYFNARDPRRVCAPDVFVRLGVAVDDFDTWRIWERGAPDLSVEIVSTHDRERWTWEEKLERYHELGVRELVRFDADAPHGSRVRVWDRVSDDLVEREVDGDSTPCVALGLWWVVAPVASFAAGLRLSRDAGGRELVPTPEEACAAAQRRIAELEAEIAARRPR